MIRSTVSTVLSVVLVLFSGIGLMQAQSATFMGANSMVASLPATFWGVAADRTGNVYIAYNSAQVIKVTAAGVQTTLNTQHAVSSLAVDLAGNVYYTDYSGNAAYKRDGATGNETPIGSGLSGPRGIAVDNSGDVYIGDAINQRVVKAPWTGSGYGAQSTVGSGYSRPEQVAVDDFGNVYVADSSGNQVVKVPWTGSAYGTQQVLGGGLGGPSGVAVDGNGNVYAACSGNSELIKITPAGLQTVLNSTGGAPVQVAAGPDGKIFYGTYAGYTLYEMQTAAVNFGTVNVKSGGPTYSLGFTFNASVTLAKIAVLTQGVDGVDFKTEEGGSCGHGAYGNEDTCNINVSFSPSLPGMRNGAVVLYDDASPANALVTVYLYGIGVAPMIGYGPGVQSYVATDLGSVSAIAVDGAGTTYAVDAENNLVKKITAAGVESMVALEPGSCPRGIAVDGAGNLFVADNCNDNVQKVSPSGAVTTFGTPKAWTALYSGFSSGWRPFSVAVDGAGNVYVLDVVHNAVLKVTPDGASAQAITAIPSGIHIPNGIAVDGAGNVFVASGTNPDGYIWKYPADGSAATNTHTARPAYNVAIDAAGDVYYVEGDSYVVKLPADGSAATTVGQFPGDDCGAYSVAVDGSGNVYGGLCQRVVKVDFADPPSLTFPDTNVGSVSPAQDIAVINMGNASLTFTQIGTISTGFNFPMWGADNTCESNSIVDPGTDCVLGIEFAPKAAGVLSGEIELVNNALNVSSATQDIPLGGTGLGAVISVPTVDTTAVTAITSSTARSGGDVTSDGGATVTALGVCWGLSPDPTFPGSCTSDSPGTGAFNSLMLGLNSSTTYHVRAYATNSAGTAYGSDLTFTTAAPPASYDVTIAAGPTNNISWSGGSPNTLTPNASGATISVVDLAGVLNSGTSVVVSSTGNILVASPLTWNTGATLDLGACGTIQIDADIAASGNAANLVLNPNTCANGGSYNLGNGAQITLSGTNSTVTIAGAAYTVINTPTALQGMGANLSGAYVLGSNLDASATATWTTPCGFTPIGDATTGFGGIFDGFGHVIDHLTINCPSTDYVGLFGVVSNTTIVRNLGLLGESVIGHHRVGGLAGQNDGLISNVYNSGTLTGATDGNVNQAGGLVGFNDGAINLSYTAATVVGGWDTGGLVGRNDGTINNAYSRGSVTGYNPGWSIGGFAGGYTGNITNSYSTGSVSGGGATVGGFAGWTGGGALTSCYWDTQSSGMGGSYGGSGLTTSAMMQQASFSGWDFANIWGIYEGASHPFLRALTRTPAAASTCVPQPDGLVSWWRGEGDTTDQMGLSNGTAENGVGFATGEVGQALSLNGSNQYVLVGDPTPNALQLQNQLSLSAWIYATTYPVDHGGLALGLIMGSQYDTTKSGATIFLDGRVNPDSTTGVPAGHIHFQIGDGDWHACNSQTSVPLNQWVLITATRTANQDGIIYFNGVPQPSTCVAWSGSITYQGAWFAIGQQKDLNRPFNGLIDEAQIYNRALTSSEVMSIFDAGPAGLCIPAFTATPLSLDFSAAAGGSAPASQSISVQGPSGTTMNWTATKTQSWLSLDAASGTTAANIKVSVDQAGLAAGTYSDTITLTSPGASGSPAQIAVTLTVSATPALSITASSLSFSGTAGGTNPASQSFTISNSGGGTLNWSAAKTQSWLTIDSSSGTAPSTINASVNMSGLAAGTYSDTLTIAASGATGSPVLISVKLTVSPGATISVSPASLAFSAIAGASAPAPQAISISNPGSGTVHWTAVKTQSWLTLDNASGTAPATIHASVNSAGMSAGTYTDTITLTSADAANSPQAVTVTLNVEDFQIAAAPGGSLSATVTAGSSAVFSLTATEVGGFSGPVSFACSGQPPVSSCSVNPGQITLSGTSAIPFAVTVSTVSRTTTTVGSTSGRPTVPGSSALPPVALCLVFGGVIIGGRRRRQTIARWLGLLMLVILGMSACGGHHAKVTTGTPAGTYTISITATTGNLSHTTNLSLTVN